MTTQVIIRPYGHNAEAVITEVIGGESVETVHKLDPHGESTFTVYDSKTVTVREVEGWAPKPEA